MLKNKELLYMEDLIHDNFEQEQAEVLVDLMREMNEDRKEVSDYIAIIILLVVCSLAIGVMNYFLGLII